MSKGRIVQIIGAVIDVEFPRDAVPKIYDALTAGKQLARPVGLIQGLTCSIW